MQSLIYRNLEALCTEAWEENDNFNLAYNGKREAGGRA